MSDIELVIKIDANIANGIIYGHGDEPRNIVRSFQATIADAIKNGTPLDDVRTEIESKCDRINSLASVLPYTAHREIQGLLCDIMDLRK